MEPCTQWQEYISLSLQSSCIAVGLAEADAGRDSRIAPLNAIERLYLPLPTVLWGERETGRGGTLPHTREARLPTKTPEVHAEPPRPFDAHWDHEPQPG